MPKPYQTHKKRRRKGDAESLSAILPAVGKALNLDKKIQEWAVLSLWAQVVDEPFREKTRALKIRFSERRNHLLVWASNSAVAAELAFHLENYRQKLNAYGSQTGISIHRIDLHLG